MGPLKTLMSSTAFVEWAVADLVYPGQVESGDRPVFAPFPGGVLLGVVDGVGHGEEATAAARAAVEILEAHRTESVVSQVRLCHSGLRRTRGVVMSLASYDARARTMSWIGIGNVEGILLRADSAGALRYDSLLLRGGVVGHQLPTVESSVVRVSPGDTLILATDGVKSDFVSSVTPGAHPQQMADDILALHRREADDALVLAARFRKQET
jgi:serine phosphatase RsbU (regulator of sigma subunit)